MWMIVFEWLYKILNLTLDNLLMMWAINIIETSVNGQYFDSFLSVDPFLMSFMDSLYVLESDVFLSLSVSDFDSL